VAVCALWIAAAPVRGAVRYIAVVASAESKLAGVTIAELAKLCQGTMGAWPDGKSFTLVMKDPETPEMHLAVKKLFGVEPAAAKAAITKVNAERKTVLIVESDDQVLRTVAATPGAVGLVDVYAINRSVKVLHVDGKLPFEIGYTLRGN
jgi:ABC-type phosphate transport system substrate-binding protein